MDHQQMQQGQVGPQYLTAIIVNLLNFAYGLTVGWPSPMQIILQANATNETENSFWDTGVSGMSDEAFSWIGGIFCIGGMFGTPVYGYLSNAIGRKKSLILAGIPLVLSACLIAIATHPMYLFAARFLSGLGGAGAFCVVPMYVGEIAEDRVRGVLGSFLNLFVCVGILTAYIVGSYTSYMFFTIFCLISAMTFLILAMWLPESPVYSLMNERPGEAFNALVKLQGNNTELVQRQVNRISAQVQQANSSGEITLREMFQDPTTRKALMITLTLCTIQQAGGISPIIAYSVSIFQAAGSTLSPPVAAIIIGALQIVGAAIATVLMDKAGRKMLLMISSVGMTVTLAPIAYFLYLKSHGADADLLMSIGWLPVTSLAVFIVVFGLGFGPVPFVLVSELFKNEVKGVATSICMMQFWTMAFLFLKFFSTVSSAVGIESCFGLFALCTLGGAIFTYFCVFETKGKSMERILQELNGSKLADSRASPIPFLNKHGDQLFTLDHKDNA